MQHCLSEGGLVNGGVQHKAATGSTHMNKAAQLPCAVSRWCARTSLRADTSIVSPSSTLP